MSPLVLIRALGILLAFAAAGACQPARRPAVTSSNLARTATPAPATRPSVTSKPLIDFGRGAAGLPLATKLMPADAESLRRSLAAAYAARVETAPGRTTVQILGNYPSLDVVKIDLSGGSIRDEYRPTQLDGKAPLAPVLEIGRLEYIAWPMRYGEARSYLRIKADNVKVALLRSSASEERGGTLVMTAADAGLLQFHMTRADIRTMLLTAARAHAGKAVMSVSNVTLSMISPDDRQLNISMRVDGSWFLIPTSVSFSGTMSIDDSFNARFSDFGCRGNDVGGALLAGFIAPALNRFNGKVSPLAHFAGGRIHVTGVNIDAEHDLSLRVEFGNR